MRVNLSDLNFFAGRSGMVMRCTISLSSQDPDYGALVQSVSGCLVCRNRKEEITILPPVIYLGPARVRHRPIVLSPGLTKYLADKIDRKYGKHIYRHKKDKDGAPVVEFFPASSFGLPDELDLSEEE